MKKLKSIILTAVLLCTMNSLFSQQYIRELPYFIDIKWQNHTYKKLSPHHMIPPEMPPEAYKIKPGAERILASDGIELINISKANNHQSETWIAINPNNPDVIVAGANDNGNNNRYAGYRMTAYYSTDGGKNWSSSQTPKNLDLLIGLPSDGGNTNVDPGIAFDSKGNAYYIYIFTQLYDDGSIGDNGVFVSKSTNNGKNWLEPSVVVAKLAGTKNQNLQDKCFIAGDANPSSPFKDRLYAVWSNMTYPNEVNFAYSVDGDNWSAVSSVTGANNGIQSPLPVVGPNGVLYLTWEKKDADYTNALVQKSTNGGVSWTWSAPKFAQRVKTSGTMVGQRLALHDKGDMRVSSHPDMSVDMRNGNIYLVQTGKDEEGKYEVFMTKSIDGGETWSVSKRVDNNSLRNDLYMPGISVDPVTGMLAITYYSSQNSEDNKSADYYLAVSFDGGENFNHVRISPQSWYYGPNSVESAGSESLGRYWGDYTAVTAYNGKIYPCFWMPTNLTTGDYYSVEVYTAILSTAPKPPSDLAAANSYLEPSKVTLTWKDPQQNQLGGALGDFRIYIMSNGNKVAEVNKGVQQWVDNSVVPGSTYNYSLKTHTTEGQESSLTSISGVAGGVLEPKIPTGLSAGPKDDGIQLYWTNPSEHIDGSVFYDFSQINIYINDNVTPIKTVSAPEIQAGQASSVSVNLPVKTFYRIKLKAVGKRGEKVTESQFSEEIVSYSGAPLTEFSENFDNTSDTIATYTFFSKDGKDYIDVNGWGKVQAKGTSCITDSPSGMYTNAVYNTIVFAPAIIKSDKPTLSFDHIALILNNDNDYGVVDVSTDFGNSWKNLICVDVTRSSGFDATNFDINASSWFAEHRDLTQYIGDTVLIRFRIVANNFKNRDGWYVDNIVIDDSPASAKDNNNLGLGLSLNIYPNPAANTTNINLTMPVPAYTNITIYDLLGNQILNITDSHFEAGSYNFPVNLSGFAEGNYLCNFKIENISKTLPIIIMR